LYFRLCHGRSMIIHLPPASVHRDPHAGVAQHTGEPRRGELTALVGVEDLGTAEPRESFL